MTDQRFSSPLPLPPDCLACRGWKDEPHSGRRGCPHVRRICPCETLVEEPGPHIPECPFSDPDYDGPGVPRG